MILIEALLFILFLPFFIAALIAAMYIMIPLGVFVFILLLIDLLVRGF